MVIRTECVPAVIPIATVAGVGKEHILMLVIANPVATTIGLDQFSGFAAQSAARFRELGLCCSLLQGLPFLFRLTEREMSG